MGQCKRVAHAGKISGMNDIALAKAQLRQEILLARKQRQIDDSDNLALCQNILSVIQRLSASRVAIYESYPSEPDTHLAIAELLSRSVSVLVPETFPDGFLSWRDKSTNEEAELNESDLLFIPALAIDLEGNRLGRGKGYFDRELEKSNLKKVYAIVFEAEVLAAVPVEAHDRKVTGVVTEVAVRELN